jgi:arginine/lysine/ornithine decarboxylase
MHKRTPLYDALIEYKKEKIVSFDVPGHKKGARCSYLKEAFGKNILEMDANSMRQLDNLSNPIGVIKEAEDLMADAYNSDYAFFLVNGTTSGVQAMIMSICQPGDKVILPRNVHKSAINALILSSTIPVYMQPEVDTDLGIAMGISVEEVERAINENPDAKAIFLMNPTYYGACSDLKKIIEIAHKNDIAVLVDEAHGAHLAFHPELPENAMKLGADMACVSLHKTGGSLTQSSALLLNERIVTYSMVKTILNLTQTTSASYLLMGSLDIARKDLILNGKQRFDEILELVREYRDKINKIDGMHAFGVELIGNPGVYNFDETKLGINVSGIGHTGIEAYDILREKYGVQMELGDAHNILGIVSTGDTRENLERLYQALKDMSVKYRKEKFCIEQRDLENPELVLTPREAFYAKKKFVNLCNSLGMVSGESVMAYPPGIPIIVPGERINEEVIKYIKFLKKQHSMLAGTVDPDVDKIEILDI